MKPERWSGPIEWSFMRKGEVSLRALGGHPSVSRAESPDVLVPAWSSGCREPGSRESH